VSYVRTLYKDWTAGNSPMRGITSFFAFRAEAAVGIRYREEWKNSAAEVPWFKYVLQSAGPWEDEKWTGKRDGVDDLVRSMLGMGIEADGDHGYCGASDMVEIAAASAARRLAEGKHVEKFIFSQRKRLSEEFFATN